MTLETNDELILGLPRRPRIADMTAAAILGALALGLITKDLRAALAGGTIGAALASRRQPLELAVRTYLEARGCSVINFYQAPRLTKVTVSYSDHHYWTIESLLPGGFYPSNKEDRDDWHYGNLVTNELPRIQQQFRISPLVR